MNNKKIKAISSGLVTSMILTSLPILNANADKITKREDNLSITYDVEGSNLGKTIATIEVKNSGDKAINDLELALNFNNRTTLYQVWDAKELKEDEEDKNTICLEDNATIKADSTYSFSIITATSKLSFASSQPLSFIVYSSLYTVT